MRSVVLLIILATFPLANASNGWLFYGHRRPSLSSMAKGFMPESERVQAESKPKGEFMNLHLYTYEVHILTKEYNISF